MNLIKTVIGLLFLIFQFSLFAQNELKTIENQQENLNDTTIYTLVDTMPEFINYSGKDAYEKLTNFINSNLKWPSQDDCEGTIFIKVIIEKDGSLSNNKILKGLDCMGFNEEAQRVVKLLPKWKPGKLKGKIVRVSYIIPIKFHF